MRLAVSLVSGGLALLFVTPLVPFGLFETSVRAEKDLMPAALDSPLPSNIEFHSNITYHTVGTIDLGLDLARPVGKGPFPALVVIHGLDPAKAGRKPFVPWIIGAAKKGYAAVAISYRSKPEHGYQAPIHDAKAAVRWLRANAVTYGIDKDRIAALGFSGGGTIACLLGMASPQDGLEGPGAKGNSQVQAVVSYFPITDWKKLHSYCSEPAKNGAPLFLGLQRNWIKIMIEMALGGSPAKVDANYTKVSPITYVRKGAAPMLLIQGSHDTFVPPEQSQTLKQKMDEVGANVQLLTFDRAPHNFERGGDPNAPWQLEQLGSTSIRTSREVLASHLLLKSNENRVEAVRNDPKPPPKLPDPARKRSPTRVLEREEFATNSRFQGACGKPYDRYALGSTPHFCVVGWCFETQSDLGECH